ANICHAYQILKSGGLKDENIIVFMRDDLAYHPANPTKGVVINNPSSQNYYPGVPKVDYIGNQATAHNFYSVLLGNAKALTGGSGKVLKSSANDYIFLFHSDHGDNDDNDNIGIKTIPIPIPEPTANLIGDAGAKPLGMPIGPTITSTDLLRVLGQMHAARSYYRMVIYLDACKSGSMFYQGLPNNIGIYAMTSANESASSKSTEDRAGRGKTLEEHYNVVEARVRSRSQVMRYGDLSFKNDLIGNYIVFLPSGGDIDKWNQDGKLDDQDVGEEECLR
ncbi:Peptidase C13, legumain, partial [Parasponia andersonii]